MSPFRILHTVFPEFFPEMYSAGISSSLPKNLQFATPLIRKFFPEYVLLYDVKEKIDTSYIKNSFDEHGNYVSSVHAPLPRKEAGREGHPLQGSAFNAVEILESMDIGLHLDDDPKNFITGIYVDSSVQLTALDGSSLTNEHLVKLTDYMRDQHFEESAITKVERAFARLNALE